MRNFKIVLGYLLIGSILFSCIKDEALNSEADIEACALDDDLLKTEPIIGNNTVAMMVKSSANVSNLAPQFVLTPGATISPESGTTRDFTSPQTYIVTSQDEKWSKTYTVTVSISPLQTKYNFEHFELYNNSYYIFYEIDAAEKKQDIWASGNGGFSLVASGKKPEDYPTAPYKNGLDGYCAKLETRSTGSLGAIVNMRLAAGNLFIGKFDVLNAIGNALGATQFGLPVDFIPTSFTGYYKYKAGETYQNNAGKPVPDKKDTFDLYAILYETDNEVKYLDGRNSLTSPNLIMVAKIKDEDKLETDEWTYFDIPFIMQEGKTLDIEKLNNDKYNLSIVLSSSKDGALFEGAVGSTLLIDKIELKLQ